MAYGLTYKSIDSLCTQISEILVIPFEDLRGAFIEVIRKEALQTAQNVIKGL